jgi:hypothetical protein
MMRKKSNVRFTAEHLALLLMLWQQVENEKEEAQNIDQSTRIKSGEIPKLVNIKRAFQKLWKHYKNPPKLHTTQG